LEGVRRDLNSFSLGSINAFGKISHDISMVRDDRALTNDEFAINPKLVEQLVSKSTNGKTITFGQLAQFRKEILIAETRTSSLVPKANSLLLAKPLSFTWFLKRMKKFLFLLCVLSWVKKGYLTVLLNARTKFPFSRLYLPLVFFVSVPCNVINIHSCLHWSSWHKKDAVTCVYRKG
jgi:hypothetical protein